MAILSSSTGVARQFRASTGGTSAGTTMQVTNDPRWLRLTRTGDRFEAFYSYDGFWWSGSIGEPVTVPMPDEILLGLAVTSHSSGTLATAVFDDLVIDPVPR